MQKLWLPFCSQLVMHRYTEWATKKVALLPFCKCPCVIFLLALVCILRRVFEQLVNSRAVTISPLPPLPLIVLYWLL